MPDKTGKEVTSDSQQADNQEEDSLELEEVDNQQVARMQEEDIQRWVDKPDQGVTFAEQVALP